MAKKRKAKKEDSSKSKAKNKKVKPFVLKEEWKTILNECLGMGFKGTSRCCRNIYVLWPHSSSKTKKAVQQMVKENLLTEGHTNEELGCTQYKASLKACDVMNLPAQLRVRAGVCR